MKRTLCLLLVIVFIFLLTSCAKVESVQKDGQLSMFVVIEITSGWEVVYHRDTKVMYAVSTSSYNIGNFTLLVNPDGTPMIYTE